MIWVFGWDGGPNVDLLDKRVLWWSEEHICLDLGDSDS